MAELQTSSTYTLIACDADADICNFDAVNSTNACSVEHIEVSRDDLKSYEHVGTHTKNTDIHEKCRSSLDTGENSNLDRHAMEDLSKEEMECEFHVIEKDEIQSACIQDRSNNLYSTLLTSVSGARQNLIKLHLAKRENEFTDLQPFSIFTGTWNVNGKLPSESLVPWLQLQSESQLPGTQNNSELSDDLSEPPGVVSETPDLIALGFQELDLSVEALVYNNASREDQWIDSINQALPSKHYFKIKQVRLVGMMLVVYALDKHRMHITNVESGTQATGMLGLIGNKGGVSIRFQLHHSTICFANSHLAAFQEQVVRRNQDFHEVYKNLKFMSFQPPLTISSHDMVFWLGDFNYRIDLDIDKVKHLCELGDFKQLYIHDQLSKQRSERKAFGDFTESQPTFKPTYKFDPETDDWDSSEKSRIPAWCDRVLWKGKHIHQLNYGCHSALKLSDHKPVSSNFNVNVKIVDPVREQKVVSEIVRKLDKEENECLPHVKLASQDINFGTVTFMERKLGYFSIQNTGHRTVEFEFVPKSEEKNYCQPWFSVNTVVGFIMPGDCMEIEIALYIDKSTAPLVKKSSYQLNDILVLHLVNGKDFFVSLNAEYKPSVFGSSLDILVRTRGPINDIPIDSLLQIDTGLSSERLHQTDLLEIPHALSSLINHLHKFGMTKDSILLRDVGTAEDLTQIRTYLDTEQQEGEVPGSIYSVGNALLLFLESLCEPVIPLSYHSKCLEVCNDFVLCKQVVNSLPLSHFNVFKHICTFLRQLLKHCEDNKLNAQMVAALFGPLFLRPSTAESRSKILSRIIPFQIEEKKSRFVFHFLVNDFD